MSAPPARELLSVEAARDAVLAVTEPVGTESIIPAIKAKYNYDFVFRRQPSQSTAETSSGTVSLDRVRRRS